MHDVILLMTLMPKYHRAWLPGGTWFFTLALLERRGAPLLVQHIDLLREAVTHVRVTHPFTIHAWVVLPEHMHCIITLPEGDTDFALRWRLIKARFSRGIPSAQRVSISRQKRGERAIWQRRYWEHMIRDVADWEAHMNYIHFNPVKHGLVRAVHEWPYSTFHKLVERGWYQRDWGVSVELPDYRE